MNKLDLDYQALLQDILDNDVTKTTNHIQQLKQISLIKVIKIIK